MTKKKTEASLARRRLEQSRTRTSLLPADPLARSELVLRGSIALVWLITSVTCLHPYYAVVGESYLSRLSVGPWLMYLTCAGEFGLALWILSRPMPPILVAAQCGAIALFTTILATLEPALLASPFGVLSKNLSMVIVLLATWRLPIEGFSRRVELLLRVGAALPWLTEGLVPKLLYQQEVELRMAPELGLTFASPSVIVGAVGVVQVLSFVLALTLRGRARAVVLMAQAGALVALPLIVGSLEPRLWVHPFGPFSKNLPVLGATLVLLYLKRAELPWSRSS